MSQLEELKSFKNFDPGRKLAILRSEMLTPISTIRGFTALMKKSLEEDGELPPDLPSMLEAISSAADTLHEVLAILTDPKQ